MGVYASHFHARYPTHATLEHLQSSFWLTPTGLSPSMVWHSSQLRVRQGGSNRVQTPHLFCLSAKDSVCPMPLSFASTHGIAKTLSLTKKAFTERKISFPLALFFVRKGLYCFLFLRVLRCFNSPRSQSHAGSLRVAVTGSPIRRSPDQRLLAPTRSISQLGTTFLGA